MKHAVMETVMAVILAWVCPWFLVSAVISAQPESAEQPEEILVAHREETPRIPVKTGDGVVDMPLEDYLTAVLLAELPASFHREAKMAQAVVARTYALRTVSKTDKHPGMVCCDSTCCQGYRSPESYLQAGGTWEGVEEAREAVRQTAGQVLTYGGELIDATYFACSGGYTEPAVAVWGSDVPYLQAVPSPGEEGASHYRDTVTLTAKEFSDALGLKLTGDPSGWFGAVTYTQGGGVAWMTLGGKRFSGTQLRSLLGLRSTAFTVAATGETIQITTRGHGHRVGMSQYGAQAMASQGHTWRQILAHYYPNTMVTVKGEN